MGRFVIMHQHFIYFQIITNIFPKSVSVLSVKHCDKIKCNNIFLCCNL